MNPVQFKVSSEDSVITQVKGMTVFNTEQVNIKKQPMFLGKPLEYKDTIHTNIQYLINSLLNN